MPQTSEHLPLLGIYYAATNVIVSLSTTMSVLTLHINNKGHRGHEIPKLVKKIFFKYIAPFMQVKLDSESSRKLLNNRLLNEKINTTPSFVNSTNSLIKSENMKLKLDILF